MTRFGVALHEATAAATLEAIRRADALGVRAVWLTSGTPDPLTLFAAAAVQTERVRLGTAIVPTWLRHPAVLAEQAAVLESVAPGRLRLGVGPSHQPKIEDSYGVPFARPLGHLREYVAVLRQALYDGKVDIDGRHFHVHLPRTPTAPVPLLVSALREASFRLAGEVSDGALAWICPAPYLARVAAPALRAGAEAAGRPVPPLVAHTFLCANPDAAAVREDARRRLGLYPTLPFYRGMLAASGDTRGAAGEVSDFLVDAVVQHGTEEACARRLQAFAEEAGADEVICSLMGVGSDRARDLEAGMRVVAGLQAAVR